MPFLRAFLRGLLAATVVVSSGCQESRTIMATNSAAKLYSQHRYAEALAKYDEAVRLTPAYGWGHLGRGNCLVEMSRTPEAIEAYRQAAKLLPDEVEPALWLGIALGSAGRGTEAVKVLERAATLAEDDPRPHVQLGMALQSQGESPRALEVFEAARQRWPTCMDSSPAALDAYDQAKRTVAPTEKRKE